jgi:hypothetical protein
VSPTTTSSAAVTRRVALRVPAAPWDAIAAWALAFALVFYLALRGGGYDVIVRDQVGILVWWVVLLVAVAGLLPRLTKAGWVALALLAAWAAWTAIGVPGSESAERTLAEVGRLSTYVGVLLLALAMQLRAGSRHVVNGVASAIGLITAMAVLSRLHPQWFPANDQAQFLPDAVRRLSYPLNYWNALAGFMAMGAVLLLGVAATARTRAGQFLAAAAVPLAGLGVYLCVSRGGAIVLALGLVVYFALTNDRLAKGASLLVAGVGGAILIDAATQRDALQTGLDTAAARAEGTDMLWLCVIVCAGVGLLQVAINLLARHANRPRLLVVPRRVTGAVAGVLAVLAVLAFFGTNLHNQVDHRWAEFKTPPALNDVRGGDVFSRLQGTAGQGRYQYWEQAAKAYHSEPVHGIGAGTFELWWARHATIYGSVIDAHSLYAQTLAELGLVGIVLLGLLIALSVGWGAARALMETGTARTLLAAATAAIAVFWVHAAVEWTWQIAAMPAALLFLIAVVVGHRSPLRRPSGVVVRAAVVLAAIAAFVPIALGLSTTQQVRESQAAARDGRLVDAMNAARRADGLQGTSTSAMVQEALLLEHAGALRPALSAAVRATRAEPTNWRTWIIRSRLEARLGQTKPALADFRTARRLNPLSPLFTS